MDGIRNLFLLLLFFLRLMFDVEPNKFWGIQEMANGKWETEKQGTKNMEHGYWNKKHRTKDSLSIDAYLRISLSIFFRVRNWLERIKG